MSLKMMWIGITGVILVALLVALSLAATMPKEFVIEESITIAAPKERIFPYLAELLENEKITKGKLTITSDLPNEHVRYDIYFANWKDKHSGEIRLTTVPQGSRVTWVMSGTRTFKQKFYSIFLHAENKIREDLIHGLRRIKELVDKEHES